MGNDIKNTPVGLCVQSLQTTLQSIAGLKNKVLFATNEQGLIDNLKGVRNFPSGGVVYEGMRAVDESGATNKIGGAAVMVFSLILVNRDTDIVSSDQTRYTSIQMLDELRGLLMGTDSPTGRKWKFVVEAAADAKDGVVFWVQRWSCPLTLTPAYG